MPTNPDLEWAIEDVRRRQDPYALFRQYDEGNHRLLFATEKFRNAFGDLFQEFANNLCDDVVDGLTDRLQVIGWTATEQSGLDGVVTEVWERNQGPSRAGAVHRNAVREGDGFTIVQTGKDGLSRIYKQNPSNMAIRYSQDAPDEKEVAAKVWKSGKRYRATLYYADGRVERYATKGASTGGGLPLAGAFSPLQKGDPALGEDGEWATQDLTQMPVFHYPNGELSKYGRSALAGVIPLQDGLNKSYADMLVALESVVLPLRWGTGLQVEYDANGQERDPFKNANVPGTILRVGSKEATLGQFPGAEVTGFLEVQDQFKVDIVRKGKLPPHAVTLRSGTVALPSGVALLVSEGRTIKWAKDRQRDWGTEHRAEMAYALSLDLGAPVDPADLEVEWAPPETRDEKALLETLTMKRDLGVPERQVLQEAGYSPDQVEEFLEELEQKRQTQDAMQSALFGGRPDVTPADARTLQDHLGGGQGAAAGIPAPPE